MYDRSDAIVRIARLEGIRAAGKDVLRDEAGIDVQELAEAGQQQPGADQEDERRADLGDHQGAPREARARAGRATTSLFPKNEVQVLVREVPGRHRADDDAEQRRQAQREAEHRAVHTDLVRAGQVGEAQPLDRVETPEADEEPGGAAEDREHDRLGDQLAHDPATAGAQRAAGGQFLHPAAGAHEREVGDVDGGNQQHEQDAAPEQLQRRPHVAHEVGIERDYDRVVARIDQRLLQGSGPFDNRDVHGIHA